MWPSMLSVLAAAAGERLQGAVQGFASSSGAVASILGLLIGGVLYGVLGSTIFVVSSATIFLVFLMSVALTLSGIRQPS